MEDVLDKWCINCSALLNVLKHEANMANEQKKKTIDEQDKYEKEMLSMIKIVELQTGQGGSTGRRDINENNNNLQSLNSLSNILTGADSKQGGSGSKKSARYTAKRIFRP